MFGNSGSGKSTLAIYLSAKHNLNHLDLDSLAWQNLTPPTRKSLHESAALIDLFLQQSNNWVVEGCYSDLLELVTIHANEMIFLNPGVEACVQNCKSRPWEPHKYKSLKAQNENLNMLLSWVEKYAQRNDEFSLNSHLKLFKNFTGKKTEFRSNDEINSIYSINN